MHIAGLRLWLADINALHICRGDVLAEAIAYVERICEGPGFSEHTYFLDERHFPSGHNGLMFKSRTTQEFKQIVEHLRTKQRDFNQKRLEAKAPQLLAEIAQDPTSHICKLYEDEESESIFAKTAILAEMDGNAFAQMFVNLDLPLARLVISALQRRYTNLSILEKERAWLRSLALTLQEKSDCCDPFKRFTILAFATFIAGELLEDNDMADTIWPYHS